MFIHAGDSFGSSFKTIFPLLCAKMRENFFFYFFSSFCIFFYGCCIFFVCDLDLMCEKEWHFLFDADEGNHGFRYGMAMVRHTDEKWSENSHEFNLSLGVNSLIDSLSKEHKIDSLVMMKRCFLHSERSKATFCCRKVFLMPQKKFCFLPKIGWLSSTNIPSKIE